MHSCGCVNQWVKSTQPCYEIQTNQWGAHFPIKEVLWFTETSIFRVPCLYQSNLNTGKSEHLWKHYTSSTENASRSLSRLTCMTVHSYFSFRESKCHYFHHIKQASECCFSVVLPNKVVEVNWNEVVPYYVSNTKFISPLKLVINIHNRI